LRRSPVAEPRAGAPAAGSLLSGRSSNAAPVAIAMAPTISQIR
jgi:hypothetical protein